MAGRFDPVRDSQTPSKQQYGPLSENGAHHPQSKIRPGTVHDEEFEHRDRRPSRSASIAEMLNPLPSSSSPPVREPSIPEPPISIVVREPYRPTKRVSAASTIRTPVTVQQVDEMRLQHRNSLRSKWQQNHPGQSDGWESMAAEFAAQVVEDPSASSSIKDPTMEKKRKREVEEAEESNARLVALHYNGRQDQGLDVRRLSPILPLRNFNNWIKSYIISKYAKQGGRVLDLGGGKGGDLHKWEKARIAEYVLCDIAEVSVQQARKRYIEGRVRFQAEFFSLDCFGTSLFPTIPASILDPQFDNVSLQFCLHYGWESVPKAQLMLENIARYLKRDGIFVGTIPNADLLRSKLTAAMQLSPSSLSSNHLRFGNEYYSVQFEQVSNAKTPFPPFGHKYHFTLLDAVDDVAEYVVDWDHFVSLARQNGLKCIFKKTFEEIWRDEGQDDTPAFRELTKKMRIQRNGADSIPMNADLWEATGLYLAFAFEKVR